MFYKQNEEIIKNKLDILHYLNFSNSYDALTNLLLNKRQMVCLKVLSNFNGTIEKDLLDWKLSEEDQKVFEEFMKVNDNSGTEIDKKIKIAIKNRYKN